MSTTTDPFAATTSIPSISFKDAPPGTTRRLTVTGHAEARQTTDFDTGQPATWPDGNPRMAAVLPVKDENGVDHLVWAEVGKSIFTAIKTAQATISPTYMLKPGDALNLTFSSTVPAKNPRHNPRKLYTATITPSDPLSQAETQVTAALQATPLDNDGFPEGFPA